jgi:hypothetical protein
MHDPGRTTPRLRPKPILVLGTDYIASAIGHALARVGVPVLLVRDPEVPVLRRGMAFDDALEDGSSRVEGLTAYAADPAAPARATELLAVTDLPPDRLINPALVEGVIDARLRRVHCRPDLRGELPFAIGIGPGFVAGGNVDIAIETAPEAAGLILRQGTTLMPPAESALLVGPEGQQLVRAPRSGLWWTFREIGEILQAGDVGGLCTGRQVALPLAGRICGLVRRGSVVRAGMRLLELDPRGQESRCHGISPLAATISAATVTAVHELWRSSRQEASQWLN